MLIAVAAIVVLAAAGFFLMRRPHRGAGEAGGVKRVAVLPFENLGTPEDDYFADGIADEIRGKLTSLPGLQVIARGSSTPYKKTTKTPKQIAEELWWKGDAGGARKYAEEARKAIEDKVRAASTDDQLHASLGLALAYLGRGEDAIQEGLRAVELLPVTKDAYNGPYDLHQLARIYILAGQQEKALDSLERLLQTSYPVSRAWLTIDPNFDPLRKNPRFQKLVVGAK